MTTILLVAVLSNPTWQVTIDDTKPIALSSDRWDGIVAGWQCSLILDSPKASEGVSSQGATLDCRLGNAEVLILPTDCAWWTGKKKPSLAIAAFVETNDGSGNLVLVNNEAKAKGAIRTKCVGK